MTRNVLQQGLVLSLSHPVGVPVLGLVSAETGVSCNLSLLIKLMGSTCPESLKATLSLFIHIFLLSPRCFELLLELMYLHMLIVTQPNAVQPGCQRPLLSFSILTVCQCTYIFTSLVLCCNLRYRKMANLTITIHGS